MSLNYDLRGVKDLAITCYTEADTLRRETQTLIFSTIAVMMYEITDANAEEFYARLVFWERLHSIDDDEEGKITLATVRAHIGLKTNADRRSSRAFLEHCWREFRRTLRTNGHW